MRKIMFGMACCLLAGPAFAQAAPTEATDITAADIQKVLKEGAKETDHNIKTVEMGQGYQMSVGVVHRGPTPAPGTPAPARPAPTTAACGLTTLVGGKQGPTGMLSHDATPETYIITQGSGTLVTGGQMYMGHRSADDSSVVTTLNGPTCGGSVTGNFKERHVGVGDIIIVPAGVPHGWAMVPEGGVTYLSVRPDPKYVLPRNFVYPALR
jgi:quercetin dioxygenase-like cupin family protein